MAFAATMEWDVSTTGNAANGGGFDPTSGTPGTNYANQNSPQVVYTDLVIDGTTNTKCTSAATPFTSAHVGNVINIVSGTGFTVQRVQIMSVAASVATCDKSLGTLSSTGGNGNLGGALLTIAAANTLAIASNTIHIKTGTYTLTTAVVVTQATITWRGFQTTHSDYGTKPLITTATNSTNLITTSSTTGTQTWDNLSLSNTASVRANGVVQLSSHGSNEYWIFKNCVFDGFTKAINSDNIGANFDVIAIYVINCEIKNCSGSQIETFTGTLWVVGSYIHGGAADGILTPANLTVERSIISANGASGINITGNSNVRIDSCSIANNTTKGLFGTTSSPITVITNSIFAGNASASNVYFASPASARCTDSSRNNAFYGTNTGWAASQGDVTLSASPFTSSTDFSLNATAGGGAACKAVGAPGVFPGGLTTGYPDIGAAQSAAAAGSSVTCNPLGGLVL